MLQTRIQVVNLHSERERGKKELRGPPEETRSLYELQEESTRCNLLISFVSQHISLLYRGLKGELSVVLISTHQNTGNRDEKKTSTTT